MILGIVTPHRVNLPLEVLKGQCGHSLKDHPSLLQGRKALSKLPSRAVCAAPDRFTVSGKSWYDRIFFNFRLIFDLTTPSDFIFLLPYSFFNSPNEFRTSSGWAGTCLNRTVNISWVHTTCQKYIVSIYWPLTSSSQRLYEIGTWISPFHRWRNWLRDRTCLRTCRWKEQAWG